MSIRSVLRTVSLPIIASLCFALGACGVETAGARPDDPEAPRPAETLDTPSTERAEAGAFRISGPFVHDNLSLFLVHGTGRDAGRAMMTLEEAMAAKKLVVYETGSVNELEVQNVGDVEIFIQASEIVKGGKQDRALAVDMIVPPKSGRIPIAAFCVEHGRWSERSGEAVEEFSSSKGSLNSKELRLAARYDADQSKVWEAVSKSQAKLANAAGTSVADERSSSSLQLTLENRDVTKLAESYVTALGGLVDGKEDVVGYAFAINGAVNSAEVYGSPELFRKLWNKMLHAAALEAAAERGDTVVGVVSVADVVAVLAEAESGSTRETRDAGAANSVAFESERSLLFETRPGTSKTWVHRSYVTK